MRAQVNLNDDMVSRLDCVASKMGISRSALCAVIIGQGIVSFEKAFDIFDKIDLKNITELLKSTNSDEKC